MFDAGCAELERDRTIASIPINDEDRVAEVSTVSEGD
jgi:hypothetical protein